MADGLIVVDLGHGFITFRFENQRNFTAFVLRAHSAIWYSFYGTFNRAPGMELSCYFRDFDAKGPCTRPLSTPYGADVERTTKRIRFRRGANEYYYYYYYVLRSICRRRLVNVSVTTLFPAPQIDHDRTRVKRRRSAVRYVSYNCERRSDACRTERRPRPGGRAITCTFFVYGSNGMKTRLRTRKRVIIREHVSCTGDIHF